MKLQFFIILMFTCTRVATGQDENDPGKVTEFYLDSLKIDILKKSQGKLI